MEVGDGWQEARQSARADGTRNRPGEPGHRIDRGSAGAVVWWLAGFGTALLLLIALGVVGFVVAKVRS